ncbi:MAG: protein-export chaperone SecB [Rickettsiales bacterium]
MSNVDSVNYQEEELNLSLDIESVKKFYAINPNLKFRKINSFIRDISFESKNILTTPTVQDQTTAQDQNGIQLKINVEVASGKLQNSNKEFTDVFEVIIKINAEVFFKKDGQDIVLLNLEIEYVTSVYLNPNIEESKIEYILYVDVANQILIEAKNIIAEITQYSCWKSITLDDVNIDLEKMFLEHKKNA